MLKILIFINSAFRDGMETDSLDLWYHLHLAKSAFDLLPLPVHNTQNIQKQQHHKKKM